MSIIYVYIFVISSNRAQGVCKRGDGNGFSYIYSAKFQRGYSLNRFISRFVLIVVRVSLLLKYSTIPLGTSKNVRGSSTFTSCC